MMSSCVDPPDFALDDVGVVAILDVDTDADPSLCEKRRLLYENVVWVEGPGAGDGGWGGAGFQKGDHLIISWGGAGGSRSGRDSAS